MKRRIVIFLVIILYVLIAQILKDKDDLNLAWAITSNKFLWSLVLINSVLLTLPLFGFWIRTYLGGGTFGLIVLGLLSPIAFLMGARVWFEMRATEIGTLLYHFLKISDPKGVMLIGSIASLAVIFGWLVGNVKKKNRG